MVDEIDRLKAELARSRHEDFITVEEQARRNAQELADILHGPNTGALEQVGLQR